MSHRIGPSEAVQRLIRLLPNMTHSLARRYCLPMEPAQTALAHRLERERETMRLNLTHALAERFREDGHALIWHTGWTRDVRQEYEWSFTAGEGLLPLTVEEFDDRLYVTALSEQEFEQVLLFIRKIRGER